MGRRKRQDMDVLKALLLRARALLDGRRAAARHAALPEAKAAAKPTLSPLAQPHTVEVLVEKNRLHCTLRGFLDVTQGEAILLDIQLAQARLRPGFDVIADVSRLGGVAPAAFPLLRRAATAFIEGGMRRLVRVVGAAPGAAATVARLTEGLYEARVVASMAEATRLLDGLTAGRTANPRSRRAPHSVRRTGVTRWESAPGQKARGPR